MNRAALIAATLFAFGTAGAAVDDPVHLDTGTISGAAAGSPDVRVFKGIPYAAPPVGDLRWRAPKPAAHWEGTRPADEFGPVCMQGGNQKMSEDCLYLNVWTGAKAAGDKRPVMVWIYGGGYYTGSGSQPMYDGAALAEKGAVVVTFNYRLGAFGFFSHPELTKESDRRGAANFGVMDAIAALQWVQKNIARFGGDPKRVTIAGESAGSISVSAQMASPLSKTLIAGAIGESGSITGALSAVPLSEGEQNGVKLAAAAGAASLAALRAMPAEQLLEAASKPGLPRLSPIVDGYFFPKSPFEIYGAGEQAHVPLLAGSNSEEAGYFSVLGREKPTVENYRSALQKLYADKSEQVFKLYPASTGNEVMDAAQDLAGDRFIAYSTWKWMDLATKTGGKPTYYYYYARPRPPMRPEAADAQPQTAADQRPAPRGAVHSAEIEYAMGNLDSNKVYAWTPDDYKVSKVMQEYFANFIKTGNPNGKGLPSWPRFAANRRMTIDVNTRAESDRVRARYEFLDQFYTKK